MNYYIYLIRNKTNGKIYIGKRKCPKNETPQTDKYMGSGLILKKAFKKYGKEHFEKEILVEDTIENINRLEKEFIEKYDSTNRKIGYNRTIGGDGGWTTRFFSDQELENYKEKFRHKEVSQETRQKIREKVNIPIVIKNLEKARIKFKELIDSGWRIKLSEEAKENRLKHCRNMNQIRMKRVLCIDTNTEYNSMQEAADLTNSSISKISMCCNGKRKKTNNLQWKFI